MTMNDTQASRLSATSYDRKLRYRVLLQDLDTDDVNDAGIMDKMESVMQETQTLFEETTIEERVKHPDEGYWDSCVLRQASTVIVRCSEALQVNANNYDKFQLAEHILDHPQFWDFSLPHAVPAVGYLFGTFLPTPPEQRPRAARRRVERQRAAAFKAPEKVDKLQKTDESTQMMKRANRYIKSLYKQSKKPLSYFHVVLDPGSFCSTIENIYNVSFLAQTGNIAVDLDEETGLPFITPVPEEERSGENLSENQFIVSLDMKRWQELVKAFEISEPLMVLKKLPAPVY